MFAELKRKGKHGFFALARRIGLDRAIAYSVMSRLWQLAAGIITVVLIAKFFTPELQGYYVTIISLMAIQGFVDFGFGGILLLLASHEWSKLSLENGVATGDDHARERLAEINQFGTRWYIGCAVLFCVITLPVGVYVMQNKFGGNLMNQHWFAPFFFCVVVNALSMILTPKESLLEGCNQVVQVNRMRFRQSVSGSLSVWISIVAGWGLWTLVVSNAVRMLWELRLVFVEYPTMLKSLRKQHVGCRLNWRSEIFPLQWRLGIQSIVGYFASWFMVPLTFKFHGEVVAGQLGLTWQLLKTVQAASLAWVQTRLPVFGGLVAKRDIDGLEQKMIRSGAMSLSIFVLGITGCLIAIHAAEWLGFPIAERFLDTRTLLYFAFGTFGVNVGLMIQTYIRLFKVDPLLVLNLVANALHSSVIYFVGRQAGPTGLALGMAAVTWCFSLPMVLLILRTHRRTFANREA